MTADARRQLVDATRDFLRRHAPFDRMADDDLDFRSRGCQLAYFPKDATILDPASRAGRAPAHHPARPRRQPPRQPAAPSPTRRSGPANAFRSARCRPGGATTKIFHALQDMFCYLLPRDDFMELRRRSPEFERFCTQAITETLKQSLAQLAASTASAPPSSRRWRAAGRARAPRAGRPAARDAPVREALRGDERRQGAHDRRRRRRGRARSASSRWSTCCGASCCPAAARDAACRGDDDAGRRRWRPARPRTRRCT